MIPTELKLNRNNNNRCRHIKASLYDAAGHWEFYQCDDCPHTFKIYVD